MNKKSKVDIKHKEYNNSSIMNNEYHSNNIKNKEYNNNNNIINNNREENKVVNNHNIMNKKYKDIKKASDMEGIKVMEDNFKQIERVNQDIREQMYNHILVTIDITEVEDIEIKDINNGNKLKQEKR